MQHTPLSISIDSSHHLKGDALLIPVSFHHGRVHTGGQNGFSKFVQGRLDELVHHHHGVGSVGAIDQQILPKGSPFKRILVVNVGENGSLKPNDVRQAAAAAGEWCTKHRVRRAVVAGEQLMNGHRSRSDKNDDAIAAWVEGMILGRFRYTELRTSTPDNGHSNGVAKLVVGVSSRRTAAVRHSVSRAKIVAEAVNLARHLGHEPPNVINPVTLAQRCRTIARANKLRCRILDERQMRALKMGGILAVGEGSATMPRIIILEHPGRHPRSAPLVLVGKAVTHDSGGYSIKPAASLPDMKYDKCGGMAVIAAMVGAARLKLPQRIIGVIGAAENMISGEAYRAGDIIRTASGKTVEILNTDAEGRLVLADCLYYAEKTYKPTAMIDLATLTGACEIALGNVCAGLMSTDDKLAAALEASGERTSERLWRLPLWPVYREQITGGDADLKNAGGRGAGVITAGMFLKEFVSEKTPWAHLDIAATARTEKATPLCAAGATGFGVRLLLDFLQHRQ